MATETLRPSAAGDENAIDSQFPADSFPATDHWNKVDEASPDEDTTYVETGSTTYQRDLYNLPAHSAGTGTINSIKIYFRIAVFEGTGVCYGKPSQKSGETVTDGDEEWQFLATYSTYSQTYTTNPATSAAYTWAEIDALQIGVQLKHSSGTRESRCTQVYVEVDYTPPTPIEKVINETEGITETTTKLETIIRIISEAVNIAEAISKAMRLVRRIGETETISEALVRLKCIRHSISETVNISEALSRIKGIIPIINEAVGISEALVKARTLVKRVNETVGISEHIRHYMWWILDIFSKLKSALKITSDIEER